MLAAEMRPTNLKSAASARWSKMSYRGCTIGFKFHRLFSMRIKSKVVAYVCLTDTNLNLMVEDRQGKSNAIDRLIRPAASVHRASLHHTDHSNPA
jgi:hypothetical protein